MGSTVTFTLTLVNNGPSTATGVEVTDFLPAGYTINGSTASQGSFTTTTVLGSTTALWTVGDLTSGQTVYAEVTHSDQHDSNSMPGNGSIDENDDDTVVMAPVAGCISGVLYLDENQNGVQDSGEGILPNVRLVLYGSSGFITDVETDSHGQYTFPVVPTTLPLGVPIVITLGDSRQDIVVSVGGTCAIGDYGLLITDPIITKRGSPSQADRGEAVTFTVRVTNTSGHARPWHDSHHDCPGAHQLIRAAPVDDPQPGNGHV
jgi:uncharacterized repeat protein (TIGR01451 family)